MAQVESWGVEIMDFTLVRNGIGVKLDLTSGTGAFRQATRRRHRCSHRCCRQTETGPGPPVELADIQAKVAFDLGPAGSLNDEHPACANAGPVR